MALLPHLCLLSALYGGGGGHVGYIRKALEKGFLEMYGLGGTGGAEPYFFLN